MSEINTTHTCPDCATTCTTWTLTGRTHYIECKNPACKRHMITLEVGHWMRLTDEEIQSHRASHTDYASALAAKNAG